MNWYLGTIGFSYSDWKGVFYPSDLPTRKFLTYYSRIFNSVEINSSFHGKPGIDTIKRWGHDTPSEFRFSFKVPQLITHELKLKDSLTYIYEFINLLTIIKEKLGVILFQFPPSFRQNRVDLLKDLFVSLPQDIRFAIEVRDISWHQFPDTLISLCRDYNVCWAATDFPRLPNVIYSTANFLYIRWIGVNGRYVTHNKEREGQSNNLKMWYESIINSNPEQYDTYGYFNNDYAGFAAGTANRFKVVSQLPIIDFIQPKQGTLF